MAEIRIRVEQELLDAIDLIVSKENYSSRNQLVNEILGQYITCKNDFFIKLLPPVVTTLCSDAINNQAVNAEKILEDIVPLFIKILKDLDDLRSIFYNEIPKK